MTHLSLTSDVLLKKFLARNPKTSLKELRVVLKKSM